MPKTKIKTRDKWYQTYSVKDGFAKDSKPKQEPPKKYELGDTISAIEAVKFNGSVQGFDIRPKVFDNVTKQFVLLDSGSCVSCTPPEPNAVVDPRFKLRSVNGGQIDTYGTKTMTLRIGRKTYTPL